MYISRLISLSAQHHISRLPTRATFRVSRLVRVRVTAFIPSSAAERQGVPPRVRGAAQGEGGEVHTCNLYLPITGVGTAGRRATTGSSATCATTLGREARVPHCEMRGPILSEQAVHRLLGRFHALQRQDALDQAPIHRKPPRAIDPTL